MAFEGNSIRKGGARKVAIGVGVFLVEICLSKVMIPFRYEKTVVLKINYYF